MKRRVFEDELEELAGHVAALDRTLAVLSDRIGFLEKLRDRAVTLQNGMEKFCDMLAEKEARVSIDAADTHPTTTAN